MLISNKIYKIGEYLGKGQGKVKLNAKKMPPNRQHFQNSLIQFEL